MTNPEGKIFDSAQKTSSMLLSREALTQEYWIWIFTDKYPFEMVPGKWEARIYYDDCLLLEKTFNAYKVTH
jgi:hypothetical protein